jgi:hypothetical protein
MTYTWEDFTPYKAILNPYGGVYPESNLSNFETMEKVFRYIEDGGILINVADTPGYWAYSSFLKRRLETPPIEIVPEIGANNEVNYSPKRFFNLIPFMQKLGLVQYNIESFEEEITWVLANSNEQINIIAKRAVQLETNIIPIIQGISRFQPLSPLFITKYGNGLFIISLAPIDIQENEALYDILLKTINKVVLKR